MELSNKDARIDFAKWIADNYLPNDKVEAIALSGSTARGGVDEWSDIELAIFWKDRPSPDDRQIPISMIDGVITREVTPDFDRFFGVENFNKEEMAIDIVHNISSTFLKLIRNTIETHDTDQKKQEILAISTSLIPLYDDGLIKKIKDEISGYSFDYQIKALKNIKFSNLGVLSIHADREDFLPFYRNLSNGVCEILKALSAVNRRYFPGDKRVSWFIDSLKIKPSHLKDRIEKIYRADYLDSIDELEKLTKEVIHLIHENSSLDPSDIDSDWTSSRRSKLSADEISIIKIKSY